MSNVLLSGMALGCILFLLPAFYYLPKGVLAAMIAVVGVSMVEECPHDILFFSKIHAWPELALMFAVFGATICYSVSLGMALGLGWSIVALIVIGGWRTPIRILDSLSPQALDDAEFAQIAKLYPTQILLITVSGPLTFANTNNLNDRLGSLTHADLSTPLQHHHPELQSATRLETTLIFDMRRCTGVDGCAVQVLTEIIEQYTNEDNKVVVWEPLQLHGTDQIQYKLRLSGASLSAREHLSFVTSLEAILRVLAIDESLVSPYETMDV